MNKNSSRISVVLQGKYALASGRWLFKPGLVDITRHPREVQLGASSAEHLLYSYAVNQGKERENNQRRAASVLCAQQTGPFIFAPFDFSGLTSCFPTWHRIQRGLRARTQYLGPCFWTLWSSHSHIHGEGVRNWTCDEDPGVFCCADREKLSPSPVGAAVSQDLRDSSACPGLCGQLYSQTREWSFYRRGEFHICCSIAQLCLTLCDPTECSKSGFPVHHHLPECVQTHVC